MTSEEHTDRAIAEAQYGGAYEDGYSAAVEDLADMLSDVPTLPDAMDHILAWIANHGGKI